MENSYNIYVDSALRSSGTNSDFIFQTTPNKYIQSKAKVGLLTFEWVNSFYQINSTNNVLDFSVVTVSGTVTNNYSITVPEGNYIRSELLSTITTRMNNQTLSNNTSIPIPFITDLAYKLNWRKYTPGETGALAGEIIGIYNLLPSSTIKDVLGFSSTLSFGNAHVESPGMLNLRPIDYIYLVSPNIQSSSFAPNIGGNAVLLRIRTLVGRNGAQIFDNDIINDTLVDCSYIPMQWSFKLVDKYGNAINMQVPFSFTLRIFPE